MLAAARPLSELNLSLAKEAALAFPEGPRPAPAMAKTKLFPPLPDLLFLSFTAVAAAFEIGVPVG